MLHQRRAVPDFTFFHPGTATAASLSPWALNMTTVEATFLNGRTPNALTAHAVLYAGISQDRHVAQKPGSTNSRAPRGHVLVWQTIVERRPLDAAGGPDITDFDHLNIRVFRRLLAALSGKAFVALPETGTNCKRKER
jgi:hypothetical protein